MGITELRHPDRGLLSAAGPAGSSSAAMTRQGTADQVSVLYQMHGMDLVRIAAVMLNLADYADNTQMPDLPRIARTHEFVPTEGVQETHSSKAEQKVFNACGTASQEIGMSLLRAADKLSNAWWRLVSRIQASRDVQAAIPALSACATRYGFPANQYGPADAPIKTFSDFMNWVAGYLEGAGSRGASATTMQGLSRHWTAVFVTCATPIVGRWQRLQLAAQPNFLRVHASQVRQLDELAWRLFGHQAS